MNILVVEDEKTIADILVFNLEREGYKATPVYDGLDGLELATNNIYDIILLDVMLPGIDGFGFLEKFRKFSDTPVIMLTAREEETDKILGLELGADDYITKPFSVRELMARIKANTRKKAPIQVVNNVDVKIISQDISINGDTLYKGGKILDLTTREFEIVLYLSKTPNTVVSREELMEKVWGYEYYGDLRAVDVAIRRLREKLEDNPAEPKYIITKRGIGYYFAK